MTIAWTPEQLQQIGASDELEIAVRRAGGTLGRWVPIWVVCTSDQVYVRTWYRRPGGWFGQVLESRRGSIRVPDLQADVTVTDISGNSADLRASVDNAYRTKYGHYGRDTVEKMVSDAAAATTLWLQPE
jgi:hypothetical protein